MNKKRPEIAFVRELCKDSTEEEIQAAEARLIKYLELCQEIAVRNGFDQTNNLFDNVEDDL